MGLPMNSREGKHMHVSMISGGCNMKPLGSALTILTLAVLGMWMNPGAAQAQANADYSATPPFISDIAVPNILILMDNSGSMANRACESSSCGILPDGTTSTVTTFNATTRY
jgi:type IV pilus assembly protein PilY1